MACRRPRRKPPYRFKMCSCVCIAKGLSGGMGGGLLIDIKNNKLLRGVKEASGEVSL